MSILRTALRRLLPSVAAVIVGLCGSTTALGDTAPMPPRLEPLPEIAAPPELANDPDLEPQVTISSKGGETIEETRVQGRLVRIKVTPRHGRPYYLVPQGGGETSLRRDAFDTGLSVPLWLLFAF